VIDLAPEVGAAYRRIRRSDVADDPGAAMLWQVLRHL